MALPIFQHAITDYQGNAKRHAQVVVTREYDNTPAELYEDREGALLISSTGAAQADDDGVTQFYIAPGVYRVVATFGPFTRTYRYVTVHPLNELIEEAGTERTLLLADAGNYLRFTSNSAVAVLVPAEADVDFPLGTEIRLYQHGDGDVSVTGDTGVTVNAPAGGMPQLSARGMTLVLRKVGADAWDAAFTSVSYDSGSPIIKNTVSEMVGAVDLEIGMTVRTLEHTSGYGYEGGNLYKIVAGDTGTHDNGSYIDLDNGLQAMGLFPGGANAKHFGAALDGVISDTTAIAAFEAYTGKKGAIYSDNLAPSYLKTTSDILNGRVSILRFVDRSEHAKIRAGTSTLDLNARFQAAVDAVSAEAGRGEIEVPYGTYYKPGTLDMAENVSMFSEGGSKITADDGGIMIDIDTVEGVNLRGLVLESSAAGDGVRVNGFCVANIDNLRIKGFKRGIHESGSGVGENYVTRCNIETTNITDSFGIWADTTDNYHLHNKVKGAQTAFRSRGGANKWSDNHSFRSPSTDVAIGYLIEGIETQINGGRSDTCSDANVYFGAQGIGNMCSIHGLFMSTATAFASGAFMAFDGAQILELDDVYSIETDATITNGTVTGKVYLTDTAGAGGNTRAYVNRRDGIFLNGDSVTIGGSTTASVVSRIRPRIFGLDVVGCTFSCAEIATDGVAAYRVDADVDLSNSERTKVLDNTFINMKSFATKVKRVLTTSSGNSTSTNISDYMLGDVAHVTHSSMGTEEEYKLDSVTNSSSKNIAFATASGGNVTTTHKVFLEAESAISTDGRNFFEAL